MILAGACSLGSLGLIFATLQPRMISNEDYGYDTQHQPRPDNNKPYTTDIDPTRLFDRDPVTGRATR